jgi:hypothetical protein
MTEQREDKDNVIESDEATVGGPSTHDPTGTRLRAETPGMLRPDELDERQKRIRTQRKTGGPDLKKGEEPDQAAAEEQAEDIPPTETEAPPGPSPPPSP